MEWQEWFGSMNGYVRKYGAALLIVLFFVLEGLAILPAAREADPEDLLIRRGASVQDDTAVSASSTRVPKLSEMRGPHIDDEAAMIVIEDEAPVETLAVTALPSCETFPAELWILLLVAYVALMAFNLSFSFVYPVVSHRIQWFWEALYTLAFIGMWYTWDGCLSAEWFPLAVIRMGVFLYAAYLYFFDRRIR